MYKVIKGFIDILDGGRAYSVGDVFPHENASRERIAELLGNKNKMRAPVIVKVSEKSPKNKKA